MTDSGKESKAASWGCGCLMWFFGSWALAAVIFKIFKLSDAAFESLWLSLLVGIPFVVLTWWGVCGLVYVIRSVRDARVRKKSQKIEAKELDLDVRELESELARIIAANNEVLNKWNGLEGVGQ
ncbi:MAG: hypothetical protein HYY24_17690 [Verrucomicrobia bacterium]|nr:hypothetical protein [Verrucomicrobiota bacterium]